MPWSSSVTISISQSLCVCVCVHAHVYLTCFSFLPFLLTVLLCGFSSLFNLHLFPNAQLHRSPREADIWISVEFPFISVSFPQECFIWNLQLQMAKGRFLVTEKSSLSGAGAISVTLKTSTLRGSPVWSCTQGYPKGTDLFFLISSWIQLLWAGGGLRHVLKVPLDRT